MKLLDNHDHSDNSVKTNKATRLSGLIVWTCVSAFDFTAQSQINSLSVMPGETVEEPRQANSLSYSN